jgi:anti-anti-sigma regulatory factor
MRHLHASAPSPSTADRPTADADSVTEQIVASGVLLAIVNARGAIDADTVGPFDREIGRSIGAGATKLLVDLSRAEDVTSAAMNSLLAARQRLFACGGRIAVVLSPRMRRRFDALGLARRFLIADDRLQAVRLLGLGDTASPRTIAPRPHAHAA